MQTFHAIGSTDQLAMCHRKGKDRKSFWNIFCHPLCQTGCGFLILLHRLGQVGFRRGSVWSLEDGANVFGDLALHLLAWHVGLSVLLQMKLTSLPRDTPKDSQASCFQASMIVTDDQPYPTQSACFQLLQERAPVDLVLAQRDGNAQNIQFPSTIDTHSNQNGQMAYLSIFSDLLIIGIQVQVRVFPQRSFTPLLQFAVQE